MVIVKKQMGKMPPMPEKSVGSIGGVSFAGIVFAANDGEIAKFEFDVVENAKALEREFHGKLVVVEGGC
jgi:hypothetical protein